MVDIIGRARVIVESFVDEAQAKAAGKKTGDAAAKGAESAGTDSGKTFGTSFSSSLKNIGPGLAVGAGAAIAGGLVAGVFEVFEREASGAKLVASLGLDGKEAAELNKTASKIYADNWGQSFKDVQQGVAATKSSFRDLDGDELLKASESAQIFADIFEVDVVQAAGTASIAVKQGLAKDAVEAFDLMTAAAQKVPIQFRDELQDAVTEYSSFFAQLGIDGQTAFGILADASDLGAIGIDKAGDAIKEFGIRALDTSTATHDAFTSLGLDQEKLQTDLAKGGKVGAQAFQTIVDGLNNIKDPLAQRQQALALFGTPLEDLSQTELPKFIDALANGKGALEDFDGAASRAGKTAGESTPANLQTLGRSLQEDLLNPLDKAIQFLDDINFVELLKFDVGDGGDLFGSVYDQFDAFITYQNEMWGKDVRAGLTETFTNIKTDIRVKVSEFVTTLHEGWEAIKADVKSEFDSIKTSIRQKVTEWKTSAVNALKDLPGKMRKAGGDAIQGFIDGLSNVGSSIGQSAGRIAQQFKDAINRALPNELTFFGGRGGIPAITIPLPQLATGARNFSGGLALVGERGPELVNLPRGSDVYTNSDSKRLAGGVTQNNTYVFNGPESFAGARRDADWSAKHGGRFGASTRAVIPA